MSLGFQRFNLSLSHWTSDWTTPNSFPMRGYLMLTGLPPTATELKIRSALPDEVTYVVDSLWLHEEKGVAVLHFGNATHASEFLASSGGKLQVGSGAVVDVVNVYLITQLPKYADDETHKPGR